MAPEVVARVLSNDCAAFALAEGGKQYAVYICRQETEPPEKDTSVAVQLDLPEGAFRIEWVNTLTGAVDRAENVNHGGQRTVASPEFGQDVALRVTASDQ